MLWRRLDAQALAGLAAVPGVLLICIPGFAAGGFQPGARGIATILLAALLAAWIALAPRPLAALSRTLVVAVVAMALYCGLTLLSTLWSDSPARGFLEFDRDLLYLLALALGGTLAPTLARMRWLVRAIAIGGFVICFAGFASRTFPDLFPTAVGPSDDRLSFPLTYWNSLGLLAGITLVLGTSLAADGRERVAVRALALAAMPMLTATLLLTFSRGAIAGTIGGLVIAVVVGFGPGMLSATLAAGPTCALAGYSTLAADLLATETPTTAAATAQGHELGLAVGLAGIAAVGILLVVRRWERRLPARVGRRGLWVVGIAAATIAVVAVVSTGAPESLEREYEEFVNDDDSVLEVGDPTRDRLTSLASNGRADLWDAALQEFRAHPVEGSGAGTFETAWEQRRERTFKVQDAHSLYFENMAELGVIGLSLLAAVLLAFPVGFLRRARGETRLLYAGLSGAFVVWALDAGVDWAWEMPAVTAWLFFAGGAALAGDGRRQTRSWSLPARFVVAAGILLVCVVPVRLGLSQVHLDRGLDAFESRDYQEAIDSSLSSLGAFGDRPEPYAVLGYTDVRLGEVRLAVRMMENAVELDPRSWKYHYGLALARASAGLDPRSEARAAHARNPLLPMTEAAVIAFATTTDRATWRKRALRLPLPQM